MDFLEKVGDKVGGGYQADVFEFGKDGKKVVKKFRRYRGHGAQKKDILPDIQQEILHAIFAGDTGVGPMVHEFRYLGEYVYLVMDKIQPYQPTQTDLPKLIDLFKRMIQVGLVNLDGSFGLCRGKILSYDYGVSFIEPSPTKALQKYLDEDYFYSFSDCFEVVGLHEFFSRKKQNKAQCPKK